jgi:signal transduction histidine kinase
MGRHDEAAPPTSRSQRRLVSVALAEPDRVQVALEDTGPGLDPATALRIFEPFFTTKSDGPGIGFSISRSIVEAHGGQLWVSRQAVYRGWRCRAPDDRAWTHQHRNESGIVGTMSGIQGQYQA